MKRNIFLFLFILFSNISFAHSGASLFPGYYISKQGDSVRCQIKFNDWINNPDQIEVVDKNETKHFRPEDILGFGVSNYGDYQSVTVSFHVGPISGTKYPEEFSDSTVTKDCFLKIVHQGTYTLYEFSNPKRDYFFLSYPDHVASELVYRVREKNDTLSEDLSYKNVLNKLLDHEGLLAKYEGRMRHASYSESDLSYLVNAMNEKHGIVRVKPKTVTSGIEIDIFAGCTRNTFPTTLNGDYLTGNQFSPYYSPSAGVNFLFPLPGFFHSFKVGFALGYNQYRCSIDKNGTISAQPSPYYSYTTNYTEQFTLSNSMIYGSGYLLYTITPLNAFQWYVKAGANLNISVSNDVDLHIKNYATTSGIKNGSTPFADTASRSEVMMRMEKAYANAAFGFGFSNGPSKLEFDYTSPVNIAYASSANFKMQTMALFYYYNISRKNKKQTAAKS